MASIIPENIKGKALDIEHHVVEDTIDEAANTFTRAFTRLVNPPVWHLLTGSLGAKFALYSPGDGDNKRLARLHDYFAIDISGPGNIDGEGHDWVKVEALQENTETNCDASVAMQLRASKNPLTTDPTITHFFNGEATSTFIIRRMGQKVFASYHGRNEMTNTANIPIVDKLRNTIVAAGAKAGLSNLQWEALIKGLLQPELGG